MGKLANRCQLVPAEREEDNRQAAREDQVLGSEEPAADAREPQADQQGIGRRRLESGKGSFQQPEPGVFQGQPDNRWKEKAFGQQQEVFKRRV